MVPVGNEGDPGKGAQPANSPGSGKIAVGDGHLLDAHRGQLVDAGFDRPVEPAPRLPYDEGMKMTGPVGNLGVVADHGDR